MTLPTISDIKTYLGLTGSQDDTLISQCLTDALAKAERDTGRTFATASNTTTRYSSDGNASLVIHDRPYADSSRVVTLGGVTMTEGTNIWFLPDRRDQRITATIQLRFFDQSRGDWFKVDSQWFDKNLDSPRRWYSQGQPNDLVITGVIGHPFPADSVSGAVRTLATWLYWRAKSGSSGFVQTPQGDQVELGDVPPSYQDFVREWRIRTAVAGV